MGIQNIDKILVSYKYLVFNSARMADGCIVEMLCESGGIGRRAGFRFQ